ncbi:MAG: thioredoxin family protein [Planctomycetes bacterium]|nr:thioredoxin family protein [Planctomycetota bacterium]
MSFHAALSSALAFVLTFASSPAATAEAPWREILGPAQGSLPAPQAKIEWRTDLDAAREESRRTDRPLFVTFRCLPCKQCSDFDAEVLEGGERLDPLLARFVTVRLVSASDVDLRLFPMREFQDFDLSWWGWFLAPDGRIYGTFGGRDHSSDASRVSSEALARTLERVLAHHYDPRRAAWDVDGPAPDLSGAPQTPAKLPGYASWSKLTDRGAAEGSCLHCHEVGEIVRQGELDAKRFDKSRDVYVWPLPENVGLTLVRDDGLLVDAVAPGSAAAKLGLQKGDVLGAAAGRRLFSQTDFRAALERAPKGAAKLELVWLRDGEPQHGVLALADGWRKTVISWRKSIAEGTMGAHPGMAWFFPAKPDVRRKLALPPKSLAIRPHFGPEPGWLAAEAGLTVDDTIVEVNGQSPDLANREFLAWFRLTFEPGDTIRYRVLDARGVERVVTFTAAARGR